MLLIYIVLKYIKSSYNLYIKAFYYYYNIKGIT